MVDEREPYLSVGVRDESGVVTFYPPMGGEGRWRFEPIHESEEAGVIVYLVRPVDASWTEPEPW